MSMEDPESRIRALESRVKELEGIGSNYRLAMAYSEQLRRERLYALLQAAATIHAGVCAAGNTMALACAINDADILLTEIEKREKAQAKP